jgi:hypothetical protein
MAQNYENGIDQFGKNVKKNTLPVKQNIPATRTLQGEIVTPTPANYTQPKLIQNNSFIDGSVANSPSLPNPKIQALQPTNAMSSVNQGSLSAQQVGNKIPPYTPATQQPIFNAPPVKTPPTVSGTEPIASPTTSRLGNVLGKVGSAMPAIQAGMNAHNIMNQEANFAQNIHAGSIADPNFGNELMGNKPQLSRTSTPPAQPTTGNAAVGRGGIPVVPEQYINSRAGQIENPAYKQYAASHPQPVQTQGTQAIAAPTYGNQAAMSPADTRNKITGAVESSSQMSPATSQPNRIPSLGTKQPAVANPNQEGLDAIESYKRGDKGTGWIKKDGKESYIKTDGNGVSKIYSPDGAYQREIDANKTYFHGANGGTMSISGAPSMKSLSSKQDLQALDRIAEARKSGAITAEQGSEIYAQYKQDTSPLAQQPQIAMQRMAAKGNIPAAQQLTQEAQQQALGQYQQGTLANQKATQDAANEKEQYARNSPTQKLAEGTAQNSLDILSDDPNVSSKAYGKYKLTHPTEMVKRKIKHFDPNTSLPLAEEEVLSSPYMPTPLSGSTSPVEGNKLPSKKGVGVTPEEAANAPPNTTLQDSEGNPVLKKMEDGSWMDIKTGKIQR